MTIKPTPGGGLTDGTAAEIRLKDRAMFQFVSTVEKTRERVIYMKRQCVDDEEALRTSILIVAPTSKPIFLPFLQPRTPKTAHPLVAAAPARTTHQATGRINDSPRTDEFQGQMNLDGSERNGLCMCCLTMYSPALADFVLKTCISSFIYE
jgi:hypothetical protein